MTQPHKDVPEGMQLIRVGSMSTATDPADCNHLAERPEQTIGGLGSFALVTNNVIGPGIMSLPALFRDAGVHLPQRHYASCAAVHPSVALSCLRQLLRSQVYLRLLEIFLDTDR